MLRTYRTKAGTELPLMNLRGRDYLEVKFRLVWFREERPTWRIETEILTFTPEMAYARAQIKDNDGNVMAMAHKMETKKGFPDYLEKAETGAIGRALALVGYGTQFCADELDEGDRIVDSPAETVTQTRPASNGGRQTVSHTRPAQEESPWPEGPDFEDDPATTADPGSFVVTFGKYKGLTVKQAIERDGLPKVENYIGWLEDQASTKNQTLSDSARFFKVAVGRYVEKVRA